RVVDAKRNAPASEVGSGLSHIRRIALAMAQPLVVIKVVHAIAPHPEESTDYAEEEGNHGRGVEEATESAALHSRDCTAGLADGLKTNRSGTSVDRTSRWL